MGRPALNMTPTIVRFHRTMMDMVDSIVGRKKRAEFIRQAVAEKLEAEFDAREEAEELQKCKPSLRKQIRDLAVSSLQGKLNQEHER